MIRLFAALPIPQEICVALQRRQQGLPRARWSKLDNLHITLRFFGEVQETTAEDIDLALDNIDCPAFDLSLYGVGAFGEGADVHSVWAGVEPNPSLDRLAARCETAARKAGLKPDNRNFRPHVTLAYLRRSPPDRVAAWIQGHNLLKSPPWRADHFALYSSWSTPDGSQYEVERVYRLG